MDKYGLIGFPLTHSFSKKFFNEKFEKEGTDSVYENFEIPDISLFPGIIENNPGLKGLNVTIPYKEKVIPYLGSLDPAAQEVGAVNTVKLIRKGNKTELIGFNTDTFGFETTLKPLLGETHKKALILGTGGASKAIKYVLKKLGIVYLSATIEEIKENEIGYGDIDGTVIREHTVIINATPLGTFPKVETFPAIPYEFITPGHILYDLVYNPEKTQFLTFGAEKGATIKNGYSMLLAQALKSYEIWNS